MPRRARNCGCIAATASDHKVRAYHEEAVYEMGGREYLAICAAGGDGLNLGGRRNAPAAGAPPNAYVVFALLKK